VPATWDALAAGKFITDHSRAAGEFDAPRVCALARRAASEAIAHAGWNQGELRDAALVVGTSKGPIESWLDGLIAPSGLAEVAADVASALGIGGPRLTISTACASGLHALIRAAMLIGEGTPRVLVVAAESSLHPLFLGCFQRLGVLAAPQVGCRPFDVDRAGFLVSEAGAAVCVESNRPGVAVERFAMLGDATHLTGGDPSGRTLRRLLQIVIDDRPVDLIHAHGTGTVANDATELAAIRASVANPHSSILYSHKGALGHTLGAAGLVSVVLNCRCHASGMIPPNPRTTRPLPMDGLTFSCQPLMRTVRRSIVIASGFGGAGAAISLSGGMT
jgi:3-oxoacyl-(acyl-carrier-protein) synthase